MVAGTLELYGNSFKVNLPDGSSVLAISTGNDFWIVPPNSQGMVSIQRFGEMLACNFGNGAILAVDNAGSGLWYIGAGGGGTPGEGPWEWPLNTSLWTISSPFGPRTVPYTGFHNGIDITGSGVSGTDVWAVSDGVVTFNGFNASAGNYIQIDHPDNTRTLYMHFNAPALAALGSSVVKGQVIGHVGATGDATGPHLHFECHDPKPTPVDPILYMRARGHEFGEVQTS